MPLNNEPTGGRLDARPFCEIRPEQAWIRDEVAVAFPSSPPLWKGHTLVVPRRHVSSIYELTAAEQGELWNLVASVREQLLAKYAPYWDKKR